MIKKSFCLFLFILISGTGNAQEMWGISNSNYSGNMGIFLNPATIVGAPYKYEFNIIAGDFFAENTYIYFPPSSKIITRSLLGTVPAGKNYFDDYTGNPVSGFAHALIIGPSYIKNNGSDAWGIHTALRNELSVLKAPAGLSKFVYEKYKYPAGFGQRISSTPFSFAWMNWAEAGFTYGKVYMETTKDYLKWAITGNILVGFDGLYLDARNLDYTFYDSTHAVVHSMDATLGHAVNADGNSSLFALRGLGLSTTMGAVYMHKRNPGAFDCNKTSDQFKKYDYRIGLSFLDIGMIDYFRQSQTLTVQTSNNRTWNGIDSISFSTMSGFDSLISNKVNGTVNSTVSESFGMWLPSAVSLQFDYCIVPKVYANASWVNRLHFGPKQVARGNQVDLSIRYERRKFEAAADFTMFEYKQPSAGIGLRYSFFVIGTDRLLQWLSLTDVKSFDFFFGFKFNTCNWPFKKNGPDCPAFGPM
ncbi:MAG: hypothetical protein IPJ66_19945 [Bacteroidetes bacterium]|nr:hypothetical protein [Bacteroidota bacterium]MBL0065100.1 hypothetical protein [Bacteroidota bacterium]MBL0138505.1 hypothetical protein [Bacteroidota bacterium]